jgi:hypothetical protein
MPRVKLDLGQLIAIYIPHTQAKRGHLINRIAGIVRLMPLKLAKSRAT